MVYLFSQRPLSRNEQHEPHAGLFHARHHHPQPLFAEVPSFQEHGAAQSAILKRVSYLPGFSAQACMISLLCWLHSTSVLKRDSVHLEFRQCDPSFPVFLPGSRSLQEGLACPEHNGFSVYSTHAIRLLSRCDRPSPAVLLGVRLCSTALVPQLSASVPHQEANTMRILIPIDGTGACPSRRTCFPPDFHS